MSTDGRLNTTPGAEQYWYTRWQAARDNVEAPEGSGGDPLETAGLCARRFEWHGAQKRKYRFAMSYPWVRVPPDPPYPEPRGESLPS